MPLILIAFHDVKVYIYYKNHGNIYFFVHMHSNCTRWTSVQYIPTFLRVELISHASTYLLLDYMTTGEPYKEELKSSCECGSVTYLLWHYHGV